MERRAKLLFALTVVAGLAAGCSNGCGLQPFPGGARYQGEKSDNAVNMRLSADGLAYLNSEWPTFVEAFAPGQVIRVPFGCSERNISVVGDVVISDQGGVGCTGESCGKMDGKCCPTATSPGCNASIVDVPREVQMTITAFQLLAVTPDKVDGSLSAEVATGDILVDTKDRSHGACAYLSPAKCALEFNTGLAHTSNNSLRATVQFSIDTKWDKLLSFKISNLDGIEICGAPGAPSPPRCLDPDDIDISGKNNCGDVYCGVADWDPLKTIVMGLLSPALEKAVKASVAKQSCESCGAGKPVCPTVGSATSSCQSEVCMDGTQCVPRLLGMEGRLGLADFTSMLGGGAATGLDVFIAAGSKVVVDQGLTFGTRGGLKAVSVAPCVPPLPDPVLMQIPSPDFDAEAARAPLDASGYHVGLGLSQSFLNLGLHHAQQAGAMCINVSGATVGPLNTGLFKAFLPSLGKLATRDGKDAPIMIALRPTKAPRIDVGEGTFDPLTKKPIQPLVTLSFVDLSIDFYVMLDDRYARLFTITADVSLPMSLIFTGCTNVEPALGDLKQMVTNIRTSNSEILAEDPTLLADLIPAVIGLADKGLSTALKPIQLPTLGNFKLKVLAAKGLSKIAGTNTYNHLGLYASLMPSASGCAVSGPATQAALLRSIMPPAESMRLGTSPLPWPTAVLSVRAVGMSGTPEFAFRVDGGLWSTFLAATSQGELEVTHPAFLLQGRHVIEVRSRMAEEPFGVSAPVEVGFTVDFAPPEVKIAADRAAGQLRVEARDLVSPPEALLYAYSVGGGPLSSFGAPRLVDLAAIEAAGGLSVHVKDELGNVGEATYRVPMSAGVVETAVDTNAPAGCSSVPGSFALGALGLLAALVRRRR